MFDQILLYSGSALTALWGLSHLFPTRSVVSGFGDISVDNRRIITMEWITEGVVLVFIGALVGTVTAIDSNSGVAQGVYILAAAGLMALAVVSLFTGFRVAFLPFKLCPLIFSVSAAVIMIGAFI